MVARTNIIPADVVDFRTTFGLSANYPTIILNGPDPADLGGSEEAEAVVDATWSGAVAPNATVDLVVSESTDASGGEDLSEFYIIDNNLADVMTESFSVCEAQFQPQPTAPGGSQNTMLLGQNKRLPKESHIWWLRAIAARTVAPTRLLYKPSGFGASVNLLASTPYNGCRRRHRCSHDAADVTNPAHVLERQQ